MPAPPASSSSAVAIAVYIVEDDPKTAKVLSRVIEADPGLTVCGHALSAEIAFEALNPQGAAEVSPDVVILDLELPGMDGIALLRRLAEARVPFDVLIHTSFSDEDRVFEAIREGASGYLVKGLEAERFKRAIRDVHAGGTVIEPRLARRFWAYFESQKRVGVAPDAPELTEQELELLRMVGKGLSNAEAGQVMGLERRTVRTILGHIYEKLGVNNRVQAVTIGLRLGLIEL